MTNQKKSNKKINKDKIPVVILCGGKGTRLREETQFIPKPLVKIGGKPILWHIMKTYSAFGFNNFILPVGYKGELIKEYFYKYQLLERDFTIRLDDSSAIPYHNSPKENWSITIVDTGQEAMTGARLKRVEKFITNDLFMLTYGDGVAKIDINKLLSYHLRYNKIATVTAVRPPARFGELIVKSGIAVKFHEKPQTSYSYINGGFFVLNKKIFKSLNNRENLSFEYDVLEKLVKLKELATFCHNDYWQCMDTLRDVETLNKQWRSGKAPWKIWS